MCMSASELRAVLKCTGGQHDCTEPPHCEIRLPSACLGGRIMHCRESPLPAMSREAGSAALRMRMRYEMPKY